MTHRGMLKTTRIGCWWQFGGSPCSGRVRHKKCQSRSFPYRRQLDTRDAKRPDIRLRPGRSHVNAREQTTRLRPQHPTFPLYGFPIMHSGAIQ